MLHPADLDALLPAIDKSISRNPEVGLRATTFVLSILPFPAASVASKFLPSMQSAVKSSKPEVRAHAVEAFAALVGKMGGKDGEEESAKEMEKAADEMLAILKTGKSVSPEHRVALYSMLALVLPSPTVSPKVVSVICPLIPKELANEPALAGLLSCLAPHLASSLMSNSSLAPTSSSLLVKELSASKVTTRRLVVGCVGDVLWRIGDVCPQGTWSVEAEKFAETMGKALADSTLKTVAAAPLTVAGGVGEGFVAAAVLLGPLSKSSSKAVGQSG